ncbi:hypothetical protein [Roseovarius sp. SYSU LYC5161]|uniref:hypothetical protein n=1 Tax=Roseovarius halophilus (ex Wu et al. 2025) TaxID=3376060 RepID=UPI00399C1D33
MKRRDVEACDGFEEDFMVQLEGLTAETAAGFLELIDDLRHTVPEPRNRCGVLNVKREVFALPIPGDGLVNVVISVKSPPSTRVDVHEISQQGFDDICQRMPGVVVQQLGCSASFTWESDR